MTKVNQTMLKKLITELTDNLKGETDLAADIMVDTESRDIYEVYFTPSIYSHPKCRLPPRTEDTDSRRKLCEVDGHSVTDGIILDGVTYSFTVAGMNRLIDKVIP